MDEFLSLFTAYQPTDPSELRSLARTLDLVNQFGEAAFGHDFLPGHVTASALVVNPGLTHVLLNHHKKLNLWIQFGGHSDGLSDVRATAMREAREESGLSSLAFYPGLDIFDVDVHAIPAYGHTNAHVHHDIRFLLTADLAEPFSVSAESNDLKWVRLEDIEQYNHEPSFHRMLAKVINLRHVKT